MASAHIRGLILLAAVVVTVASACATWEAPDVPLPVDVRVVPPSPSVPQELAGFSGTWKGAWGGVQNHLLAVEQISIKGASVVYAWGATPKLGRTWAGYERAQGVWREGALHVVLRDGAQVTYRMQPDGTLLGRYRKGKVESTATLRRIQ